MKKILSILFISLWTLRFFNSLVITDSVDPLNYHMVISKYIVNGLWNEAWTTIPGALMAGLFDFIYLIPHYLFDFGLKAHISSQFLHFFFSIGLGSIFLYQYLKKQNVMIALLAGICLLSITRAQSFLFMAKNDGALAFSYLLAVTYLLKLLKSPHITNKQAMKMGLLLGLIPAIKLNGLLYTAPLALYFIYHFKNSPKQLLLCASTALGILSPILYRNWYYIGAPFFPGLIKTFPGRASASMIQYYSMFMSKPASLQSLIANIHHLFTGKILFLALPFIFYKQRNIKKANLPLFFVLISFSAYLLVNGGVVTDRFLFPCYFVFCLVIFKYLLLIKRPITTKALTCVLVFILIDSKLDRSLKAARDGIYSYSGRSEIEIVNAIIAPSRLWNSLPASDKTQNILSDFLSQQYYAPINIRLLQVEHFPGSHFLPSCTIDQISKLSGFKYALINEQFNRHNPCYQLIKSSRRLSLVGNFALYELR